MKKKLGLLMAFFGLSLALGACSTSPQSQFVEQLAKISESEQNATTVDMSIADLELAQGTSSEAETNPMIAMMMSSVKDIKVTATYLRDPKTPENFQMKMGLNFMGSQIPMELVGTTGDVPKVYLATDVLASVMELTQLFGGDAMPAMAGLDQVKGKYLDVMAMEEATKKASKAESQELENVVAFGKAYQKEVATYLASLDKKSFTKKDDVITHTFTKKEISEILELTQKVAKSDEKFAGFVDQETTFSELLQAFDELTLTLKVNTKTAGMKARIVMAPSEEGGKQAGVKSLAIDISTTSKASEERVTLPAKSAILTQEELDALVVEPTASNVEELSDADFKQVLEGAQGVKATATEAEIAESLAAVKAYLTEAQYRELEAALK